MSSFPARLADTFKVGDHVQVIEDMESNSRNPIKLTKSTTGVVGRIDDRGYAIIDFDRINGHGEYISEQNFRFLSKREVSSLSSARPAHLPTTISMPAECLLAQHPTVMSSSRTVQPPKSILKRKGPKKTLTTFQKIVKRVRDPCARFAKSCFRSCGRRRGSQVKFKSFVKSIEFSPRLDGDTLPADGTIACLGLGKIVARREVPYAQQPVKRPCVDERAYVPERDRITRLRKTMGDKRFFACWQQHRRETRKMIRERKDTNKDFADRECMPESLREAQERAAKNARESKPTKIEKCDNMSPEKLMCAKTIRPSLQKRHGKRVKALASMKLMSGKGIRGIISRHGSTQCHVCSRPISTLLPDACQCLASDVCI
mmetsp:Transcript_87514/g.138203  ORF Transcript_87514/g.138203 Transcript_87514/m.138203 type:complete len:373 (-) Transcript_87514:198-1316(-)